MMVMGKSWAWAWSKTNKNLSFQIRIRTIVGRWIFHFTKRPSSPIFPSSTVINVTYDVDHYLKMIMTSQVLYFNKSGHFVLYVMTDVCRLHYSSFKFRLYTLSGTFNILMASHKKNYLIPSLNLELWSN